MDSCRFLLLRNDETSTCAYVLCVGVHVRWYGLRPRDHHALSRVEVRVFCVRKNTKSFVRLQHMNGILSLHVCTKLRSIQ